MPSLLSSKSDSLGVFVALLVFCWLPLNHVSADCIQDQSFDPAAQQATSITTSSEQHRLAQAFTPSVSGPLCRVELNIDSAKPGQRFQLEVRTTAPNGIPIDTGQLISSRIVFAPPVLGAQFGTYTVFEFDNPGQMEIGNTYAMILSSFTQPDEEPALGATFSWLGNTLGNPLAGDVVYLSGAAYTSSSSQPWTLTSEGENYDFGFRTFSDSQNATVPEPGVSTMLVIGAVSFVACLARKNRLVPSLKNGPTTTFGGPGVD